jgi:hypothetical protein
MIDDETENDEARDTRCNAASAKPRFPGLPGFRILDPGHYCLLDISVLLIGHYASENKWVQINNLIIVIMCNLISGRKKHLNSFFNSEIPDIV